MKNWKKIPPWQIFLVAILISLVFAKFMAGRNEIAAHPPMVYSAFLSALDAGQVTRTKFSTGAGKLLATLRASQSTPADTYTVLLPTSDPSSDLIGYLHRAHVEISASQAPPTGNTDVGITFLLLLVVATAFWFLTRHNQSKTSSFYQKDDTSSDHFIWLDPSLNTSRLADVAGCDGARAEAAEFIDFLRDCTPYQRVGARPPRGVLMVGPPGTGKTLLAKAIAGEAGVPFVAVSGSEFIEKYVGVGASRVRALFAKARLSAPAIIFIDEIDAIGRTRANGRAIAHEERDQTLNQLLVELDGFSSATGLLVLAATNRADILDPALRRPGRFDREIPLVLPDRAARLKILEMHAAKLPMSLDADLAAMAGMTPGFSGADLANLLNEAALAAGRAKSNLVTNANLDRARDRVLLGLRRDSAFMTQPQRRVVAYHEAGHAIVAHYTPFAEGVHKITIIPHGHALGATMQLSEEEVVNHSREQLEAMLDVLLGGRIAEEQAIGSSTAGASSDFERAAIIARQMVAGLGMSDLGPVVFESQGDAGLAPWSEAWRARVDDAVVAHLSAASTRAAAVLSSHGKLLEAVANDLLEHESMDAAGFMRLVEAS